MGNMVGPFNRKFKGVFSQGGFKKFFPKGGIMEKTPPPKSLTQIGEIFYLKGETFKRGSRKNQFWGIFILKKIFFKKYFLSGAKKKRDSSSQKPPKKKRAPTLSPTKFPPPFLKRPPGGNPFFFFGG